MISSGHEGNKNFVDDFGDLIVADGVGAPCFYEEHPGSDGGAALGDSRGVGLASRGGVAQHFEQCLLGGADH